MHNTHIYIYIYTNVDKYDVYTNIYTNIPYLHIVNSCSISFQLKCSCLMKWVGGKSSELESYFIFICIVVAEVIVGFVVVAVTAQLGAYFVHCLGLPACQRNLRNYL